METLDDIKTCIDDMVVYCDVIDSNYTTKSKIAFTHLMGEVAERIKAKCDKLEKELENADIDR